jgi:hypothetical protein
MSVTVVLIVAGQSGHLPGVMGWMSMTDNWSREDEIARRTLANLHRDDFELADQDEGQRITDEINADPEEVARLIRSREQARNGDTVPWREALPNHWSSAIDAAIIPLLLEYAEMAQELGPWREDLLIANTLDTASDILMKLADMGYLRPLIDACGYGGQCDPGQCSGPCGKGEGSDG